MSEVRPGRLPPHLMYPSGVSGLRSRMLPLHDGLRVRVVEGGAADAYPVVLVHGWGGYSYSFAETIPALIHAGYRVIVPELPGHGLSDKPREDDAFTTEALESVVRGVLGAVGIDRFSYVGHSMGGLLGLRLAGALPGLARLAVISSAGLGRVPALLPLRSISPRVVNRVVPALLSRKVVEWILRGAFGTAARPTSVDIDQYWAQTQWDAYAWACRASLHRVDFSLLAPAELRRISIPVLVISGGRDRVVRNVPRRAAMIPTARLVHIPEGGHLVMQECAARTNTELLDFLSGVADRS